MNTFKKIGFDEMKVNPFEMIGKDWMLVTSGNEKKANTMTASWGGVGVMWGKNVAFVFIRKSRFTKEFIDREQSFSLSFPPEECRDQMKVLGSVSGREKDKIKETGVHVDYIDGIPYINEGNMILTCRVMSKTAINKNDYIDDTVDETWYSNGDYHDMYIAEITGIYVRQ